MSPFAGHEAANHTLALLVELVAESRDLDIANLGCTTFKREDLACGFDPDSCFYIQSAGRIRGRAQIDLTVDPPPDLVIEINIGCASLPKLPIYAQLGVPEVWRYDGEALAILALAGGVYHESNESVALPGLDRATLSAFMQDSQSLKRTEWVQKVPQRKPETAWSTVPPFSDFSWMSALPAWGRSAAVARRSQSAR